MTDQLQASRMHAAERYTEVTDAMRIDFDFMNAHTAGDSLGDNARLVEAICWWTGRAALLLPLYGLRRLQLAGTGLTPGSAQELLAKNGKG